MLVSFYALLSFSFLPFFSRQRKAADDSSRTAGPSRLPLGKWLSSPGKPSLAREWPTGPDAAAVSFPSFPLISTPLPVLLTSGESPQAGDAGLAGTRKPTVGGRAARVGWAGGAK
jgi:hypothetical protein